jgi:hypothetical protein
VEVYGESEIASEREETASFNSRRVAKGRLAAISETASRRVMNVRAVFRIAPDNRRGPIVVIQINSMMQIVLFRLQEKNERCLELRRKKT